MTTRVDRLTENKRWTLEELQARWNTILKLEAENAELRKDRERLDWIEAQHEVPLQFTLFDQLGRWICMYKNDLTVKGKTSREAIDRAREGK